MWTLGFRKAKSVLCDREKTGALTCLLNALPTYSSLKASPSAPGCQKLFDAANEEVTNSFLMHQ